MNKLKIVRSAWNSYKDIDMTIEGIISNLVSSSENVNVSSKKPL